MNYIVAHLALLSRIFSRIILTIAKGTKRKSGTSFDLGFFASIVDSLTLFSLPNAIRPRAAKGLEVELPVAKKLFKGLKMIVSPKIDGARPRFYSMCQSALRVALRHLADARSYGIAQVPSRRETVREKESHVGALEAFEGIGRVRKIDQHEFEWDEQLGANEAREWVFSLAGSS